MVRFGPCIMPHVLHASISLEVGDLQAAIALCLAAPSSTMVSPCATGVYHSFFRYSIEVAMELQALTQDEKLTHYLAKYCDPFPAEASQVCRHLARNRAAGKYVLSGADLVSGEGDWPLPEI